MIRGVSGFCSQGRGRNTAFLKACGTSKASRTQPRDALRPLLDLYFPALGGRLVTWQMVIIAEIVKRRGNEEKID
ncbi:hypothetical protein NDU88_004045 [Pleurodeles waltl]|uniref:Uncharacterized protein n=1 Tax=Pleurodeles waltl TaxID=8319 RepID=A0AAV7LKK0_PLEWA|nr:hypothetical protein NDU88_004045 [Pleurodeles waltl]